MRKIIFILLLFGSIANVYGQRQTYKGNYVLDGYDSPTIERDRKGTVEYEYIEVNNERVLDGYFTYTDQFGSLNGYFKNGLKDGAWVYANNLGVYARKNFKNGKLDGLCESGDLKLNLKDNHFVGSFTYTKDRTTYTGQFNQSGYADGDWVIDSYRSGIRYIRTLKWENGTLASDIEFDESTGKKIDYLDPKRFGSPQAYIAYQEEISNYFERKVQSHPVYEYYENKSKHSNLPKRGMYMGEYPMTIAPFNGNLKLNSTKKQTQASMTEVTDLYNKKKYKEAIDVLEKIIVEKPNNMAEAYCIMGNSYLKLNDYANAINAYNKAIELGMKRNAPLYHNLGVAYYKAKDNTNAIDVFKKAIDLDDDGSTYSYLGGAYYGVSQFSEAINAFQKAIELGESADLNYYNIGKSYSRLGNNTEAIKAYQKAADLGNEHAKKALIELNSEN